MLGSANPVCTQPSVFPIPTGDRVKPGAPEWLGLDRTCCPHPLRSLSEEGAASEVLLGERAGSMLGTEPAQCKNSKGQEKMSRCKAQEMEQQ